VTVTDSRTKAKVARKRSLAAARQPTIAFKRKRMRVAGTIKIASAVTKPIVAVTRRKNVKLESNAAVWQSLIVDKARES
jgi:hypothetical protein